VGEREAGNTTVTNTTGTQRFPELTGKTSRVGQTEMEEGIFQTCQISTEIATFPYDVDGGDHWLNQRLPVARYCVPELANGGISKTRTQAWTFGTGINLQATFGISLSTLTGYSTEAAIKYDYSRNGWACGTHAYPLRRYSDARGVVADNTSHGNP
jgi:hypothetical protein